MSYFPAVKFIDEAGVAYGNKQINNKMRVLSTPYTYDIAKGNIANHTSGRAIGYNNSIGTTLEDITETGLTAVPTPSSALAMEVTTTANDIGTVASSGTATGGSTTTLIDTAANFVGDGVAVGDIVLNDTDVDFGYVSSVATTTITVDNPFSGGSSFANGDSYRVVNAPNTGVSVLKVQGLDGTFSEINEFVVTNGVGAVATANNYRRVNDLHSVHVGSGGVAAGNIDLRQVATPANVQIRVSAGGNQSLQAFYTVPAGLCMYITSWTAGVSSKKPTRMILRATRDLATGTLTPGVFQFQDITLLQSASYVKEFLLPVKIPAKSDVKISGNALDTIGEGSAGFGFWLEPE